MFRYRCPQCGQLLQALEIRAGKTTVCSQCSRPLTIPADRTAWLDEHGEPLVAVMPNVARRAPVDEDLVDFASPDVLPPAPPPEPLLPPQRPVYAAEPTPPVNETKRPHDQHPRRPGRVVATTPAPSRHAVELPRGVNWPDDDSDSVPIGSPTRSQMDIAADLSMVLSTRMKPPPEPPRDLNPSTAAWLLLTGLAVLLLILAMVTPSDYLWWAGFVGAVEIAIGYVWIVWMTFRREWQRGVACAVPPVAVWYLCQKKYARYRPLRFVLTGLVVVGSAALSVKAQARTRAWTGATPQPIAEAPPDLSKQSKLVQLRTYHEMRAYGQLLAVLRSLVATDQDLSREAGERGELATELKSLCGHQLSDVKIEALAAYARWTVDEADAIKTCLASLRSSNPDERIRAIRLLPKWKNAPSVSVIASAIASRIGRIGLETSEARDALLAIGTQPAEQAVIPLLEAEDQLVRVAAIDLLEKVGGPHSIEALRDERKLTLHQDPVTHRRALQKATAIQERLQPKK